MLKEARPASARLEQRTAPSLAHTVQALRAIRRRASRSKPETQIIAIRRGKQLA